MPVQARPNHANAQPPLDGTAIERLGIARGASATRARHDEHSPPARVARGERVVAGEDRIEIRRDESDVGVSAGHRRRCSPKIRQVGIRIHEDDEANRRVETSAQLAEQRQHQRCATGERRKVQPHDAQGLGGPFGERGSRAGNAAGIRPSIRCASQGKLRGDRPAGAAPRARRCRAAARSGACLQPRRGAPVPAPGASTSGVRRLQAQTHSHPIIVMPVSCGGAASWRVDRRRQLVPDLHFHSRPDRERTRRARQARTRRSRESLRRPPVSPGALVRCQRHASIEIRSARPRLAVQRRAAAARKRSHRDCRGSGPGRSWRLRKPAPRRGRPRRIAATSADREPRARRASSHTFGRGAGMPSTRARLQPRTDVEVCYTRQPWPSNRV